MVNLSLLRKKKQPPPPPVSTTVPLQSKPALSPPRLPSKSDSYTSILNAYKESSATSSGSLHVSPLRPPRLNTDQPVLSAPGSPLSRRQASEKHTLAGYVRHSRMLLGSSTAASALDNGFLALQLLRERLRTVAADLPPELLPVVNLINAQRLRRYASGLLWLLEEGAWLPCEAVLAGTELSLYVAETETPRYINIQDVSVLTTDREYELTVMQDFDNALATLRFTDQIDMYTWLSALQLAKFEHTSLNEAFTAVVLSLKGPHLSDIYTLLDHKKRFARFEWCNLRLPQVSLKWLRVYMVVIPGDNKKKGRIEVYTSDKINKKTLVLYVNDASAVYNVYPEDHHMIDLNLIMKLEGQVFVNKNFEHLFTHEGTAAPTPLKPASRVASLSSLSSFNPPQTRSRSTSVNSSSSFFVNAPSPNPEATSIPGSPPLTTHFFKKQTASNFVTTNYLYLMPMPHPGVKAIEIMIRNFIHIVDSFKLYGRPSHLSSDKTDATSMIFGLPSLPHYGYLSTEDAYTVVEANYTTARIQLWTELDWRKCFKEYLACVQQDGPYKGVGLLSELYDSVESPTSSDSIILPDVYLPKITLPSISRLASPLQPRDYPGEVLSDMTTSDALFNLNKLTLSDGAALGQPIDFASDRPLEPIVDLPTPMDDGTGVHYFAVKNP